MLKHLAWSEEPIVDFVLCLLVVLLHAIVLIKLCGHCWF